MNKNRENQGCKNCKYFINHSGAACMYAHGFKQVLLLLLLGPKPLFNTDGCKYFSKKNANQQTKACKKFNKTVVTSHYNKMGKCKCLNCTSGNCDVCSYGIEMQKRIDRYCLGYYPFAPKCMGCQNAKVK